MNLKPASILCMPSRTALFDKNLVKFHCLLEIGQILAAQELQSYFR